MANVFRSCFCNVSAVVLKSYFRNIPVTLFEFSFMFRSYGAISIMFRSLSESEFVLVIRLMTSIHCHRWCFPNVPVGLKSYGFQGKEMDTSTGWERSSKKYSPPPPPTPPPPPPPPPPGSEMGRGTNMFKCVHHTFLWLHIILLE